MNQEHQNKFEHRTNKHRAIHKVTEGIHFVTHLPRRAVFKTMSGVVTYRSY